MLLAIDVGNTHTVFAVHHEDRWAATWRHATDPETTEDELVAWLKQLFDIEGLPWQIDEIMCACVAPAMQYVLDRLAERWLRVPITYLRSGRQVGLPVDYEPSTAVGADRIANALGALEIVTPPFIVVDFGTGTTLDVVDAKGTYVGGAIMPGVLVGSQALFARAAKLPQVEQIHFVAPSKAIGRNTVDSLQSGIMYGYAGAVDALAEQMIRELGGKATVIATGGLGKMFMGLSRTIERFEPTLTLDGLLAMSRRLKQ